MKRTKRLSELPTRRLRELLAWAEQAFGHSSGTARAYRTALERRRRRKAKTTQQAQRQAQEVRDAR